MLVPESRWEHEMKCQRMQHEGPCFPPTPELRGDVDFWSEHPILGWFIGVGVAVAVAAVILFGLVAVMIFGTAYCILAFLWWAMTTPRSRRPRRLL